MTKVFISYSRNDRDIAGVIASALQAEGFSVWWDHEISTGERWDKVIKRELDAASAVVALWSPNSVDKDATVASEWVANEAYEGKRREILAPVLVGGGAPPFEFQRIQALDLNAWSGDRGDPAWRSLVARLQKLAGETPSAPVPAPVAHIPVVAAPAPVASGRTLLRIRRESRLSGSLTGMAVLVDGQKVGKVDNGSVGEFEIAPGEHDLKVSFSIVSGSEKHHFAIRPGEVIEFVAALPKATTLEGLVSAKIHLERVRD